MTLEFPIANRITGVPDVVAYVLLCMAAGLGAAVLVVGVASLVTGRSQRRLLPLAAAVLVFVALTHLPLPVAGYACPAPFTEPQLRPFALLQLEPSAMTPVYLGSTLANILLCAVIGALLRGFSARWRLLLGAAAGVSLAVELSQLTGLFGLFPCPWRQFDVDDLILNIGGAAAGFAVAGWWIGPPRLRG